MSQGWFGLPGVPRPPPPPLHGLIAWHQSPLDRLRVVFVVWNGVAPGSRVVVASETVEAEVVQATTSIEPPSMVSSISSAEFSMLKLVIVFELRHEARKSPVPPG